MGMQLVQTSRALLFVKLCGFDNTALELHVLFVYHSPQEIPTFHVLQIRNDAKARVGVRPLVRGILCSNPRQLSSVSRIILHDMRLAS